jgi:hypothetical protein
LDNRNVVYLEEINRLSSDNITLEGNLVSRDLEIKKLKTKIERLEHGM